MGGGEGAGMPWARGLSRTCNSCLERQGAAEARRRPITRAPGGVPGSVASPTEEVSPLLASVYSVSGLGSGGKAASIIKALLPKNSPAGKPVGKKTIYFFKK